MDAAYAELAERCPVERIRRPWAEPSGLKIVTELQRGFTDSSLWASLLLKDTDLIKSLSRRQDNLSSARSEVWQFHISLTVERLTPWLVLQPLSSMWSQQAVGACETRTKGWRTPMEDAVGQA